MKFSIRPQDRSPPIVIHTEVGQIPSQLVCYCCLFFLRTLPASNLHHDRVKVQLLMILPPKWYQEDTLQISYNLEFNFWLQHMKKSNRRALKQHSLKSHHSYSNFCHSKFSFFSLKFFKVFIIFTISLLSSFNQKSQQEAMWGISYK